jgi:hypothetical protein
MIKKKRKRVDILGIWKSELQLHAVLDIRTLSSITVDNSTGPAAS